MSDSIATTGANRAKTTGLIALVFVLVLLSLGVARALTIGTLSAVSTNYAANSVVNVTLSGMRTTNKPAETISNAAVTTRLTFPQNWDLTGITAVTAPGLTTGTFTTSGQTLSIRWANNIAKNRAFTIQVNGLRTPSQPGAAASYAVTGTITSSTGTYALTWPLASAIVANTTSVTGVTSALTTIGVGINAGYTVSFNLGAEGRLAGTTAAGANTIAVTFPANTYVPNGAAGNVTINGVSPASVSVLGQTVTLRMPAGMTIAGNSAVSVIFSPAFGLLNPTTAGDYQLTVSTSAQTGAAASGLYTVGVIIPTEVRLASANPPSAGFSMPGANVRVDGFTLQKVNGSNPGTITGITVADTGTAPASTIAGVSVYRDNGDTVYGAGDTLLNATPGTFSGTTSSIAFDASQVVSDTTIFQYWIVYSVLGTATDGSTFSSRVTTFSTTAAIPTLAAAAGPTFAVDTSLPTVTWSTPSADATTITDPAGTVLEGSALDSGSAIASVTVQIERDDGLWWNETSWVSSPASLTAAGTPDWSYPWDFDPASEDGTSTYTLYARATDLAGNIGPASTRTGIRIDNTGPAVVSALALDATHVDVVFSESLAPTSAAGLRSSFSFNSTLTATVATLSPDGMTVHLVTSPQTIGFTYTVTVTPGTLTDLMLNEITALANSTTFLSGAIPNMVITQGSDPGRPTSLIYRTRDATVAVDELLLSASGGSVNVTTVTVRGLDTAANLRNDVAAVMLYRDNGDKRFSAADTQVGSTETFSADASGTQLTFTSLALTVVPGTPASLWLVYRIGPSPTNGNVVGTRVQNGDIGVATATVSVPATITSAVSGQTIAIDIVPPAAPASASAQPTSTTSAEVTWTAGSDAYSGLAYYRVFRDGALIATTTAQVYRATGLTAGQTYTFDIRSVDVAGNESASAASTTLTMPASVISLTIATQVASQPVDMGILDPGLSSTVTSATCVTVNGVGPVNYSFSLSSTDLSLNTSASIPPTIPAAAMSFMVHGQTTAGPVPFSTSPAWLGNSTGGQYLWKQEYFFDLTLSADWMYSPGDYTGTITFTVVTF